MDPITRKLITARGDVITETSDVFATYCWNGNDTSAGIHTANAGIDMLKGGMFWGKLRDGGGNDYNWYLADTVRSPIDGTQGNANLGEVLDDTPGQKTWTVPAGVTSVSVLCIGGGGGCVLYPQGTIGASGGGGGALAYKNNISVTPGQTITYNVGDGGKGATNENNSSSDVISGYYAEAGTPSWFNGTNVNDAVVMGYQGGGAQSYTGGDGGEFSNSTGDGGGSGGTGGSNNGSHAHWAFGGGGGGYSGNGGNGGVWQAGGSYGGDPGQGGGAGGGAMWANQCGTGAYGEGASGAAGQGGSGGHPQNATGSGYYPNGGKYGGGGSSHGSNNGSSANRGAQGVVRIVWSLDGTTREFPSTNVEQQNVYDHAQYLMSDNTLVENINQIKGISKWTETGMEWDGQGPESLNNTTDQSFGYFFRKAEKFFTIVEYTGNGGVQNIPHDLKCKPSMMWIKNRDTQREWAVYHENLDPAIPEQYRIWLNDTRDRQSTTQYWNMDQPTSTHFTVGNSPQTNESGDKFIAYLFGADQAAFGQRGDEVIAKVGTYTGALPQTIDLGWEPQMVICKSISGSGNPEDYNWVVYDKVRRMGLTNQGGSHGEDAEIYPNLHQAENMGTARVDFISNGFKFSDHGTVTNRGGTNYIYYAIRNNLTTPKSATEVFAMSTGKGNSQLPNYTSNFPVDFAYQKNTQSSNDWNVVFRKVPRRDMKWNDKFTNMGSFSDFEFGSSYGWCKNTNGANYQSWMFKRAKGFFDLQFWNGDSTSPRQLPHQLGVTPEMMIVKSRNNIADGWYVYHKDIPSLSYLKVHADDKEYSGADCWTSNLPTATHFYLGSDNAVNNNSASYTGQFYATLPGISKVGSYEVNANGDSVSVDCAFAAGPRFILIKDYTNNSTDWMLFDTVRGIEQSSTQFGNAEWTTGGTYSWTCPAGVTSVCAVCVGSGGGQRSGGGGGLGWKNNIPVTPGQSYTVEVGAGTQGNGSTSYFIDANTVSGGGGAGNAVQGDGGGYVGDGGGSGGMGSIGAHGDHGGGGGAGGYSGTGGNGGQSQAGGDTTGTDGTGGAGGGGGGFSNGYTQGTGGGGVGIYGEGASGTGGTGQNAGQGGSGGETPPVSASYPNGRRGGAYGGGAGTYSSYAWWDQNGGGGAVRLVWSVDGSPVAFPSTNVHQQPSGHDAVLKLNKQDASVTDTNYLNKTNSGFTVNANTALTTPNAKYIFLAIA